MIHPASQYNAHRLRKSRFQIRVLIWRWMYMEDPGNNSNSKVPLWRCERGVGHLLQGCGARGCLLALLLRAAMPGALCDEAAIDIVRCRMLPPPRAVLHVPCAHEQPET